MNKMKNNYRECMMVQVGKTHTIYPSEEIRKDTAIGEGYILPAVGKIVVLCQIERGKCPYEKEGQRGKDTDKNSPTGDVCVCNSKGLIKKTEWLEKI
tara:strand:- start:1869 stop:2159 length:291 start_codon:yes stop_codon:yes gene_type:complete